MPARSVRIVQRPQRIPAGVEFGVLAVGETAGADRPATRLATRLAFLVAGFALACWAPLVPFAKTRTGLDEGSLGLVLPDAASLTQTLQRGEGRP